MALEVFTFDEATSRRLAEASARVTLGRAAPSLDEAERLLGEIPAAQRPRGLAARYPVVAEAMRRGGAEERRLGVESGAVQVTLRVGGEEVRRR